MGVVVVVVGGGGGGTCVLPPSKNDALPRVSGEKPILFCFPSSWRSLCEQRLFFLPQSHGLSTSPEALGVSAQANTHTLTHILIHGEKERERERYREGGSE